MIPKEVPRITTERLVLRAHIAADLKDSLAMWGTPSVMEFIAGEKITEKDVWAKMLRYAGLWQLLGYGLWAVEEKSSGKFVGEAGFMDIKREPKPEYRGLPEMGWVFDPQFHGRGYATEAIRAMLEWADRNIPQPKVYATVNVSNVASIKLATKLGFREWDRIVIKDASLIVYGRERR